MLLLTIFLLQFLIGFGLLDRFPVIDKSSQKLSLAVLLGFFVSSLVIFMLELFTVRLNEISVLLALASATLLINIDLRNLFKRIQHTLTNLEPPRIYEWIFFLTAGYLLFYSVWRTYAIPVTPYDSIVGIDLVARQAIMEGHIVSSIFTRPDFQPFLSTQPYYAPFTMLMQVIYRVTGLPFGQLWLGILTISFFVFAYSSMCERLHPVLAGFFILLFLTIPELYAYTFLLQTDFANAVFFAIAVIFVVDFLDSQNRQYLILSALFMAAACWSRTETIILVIPVAGVIAIRLFPAYSFKSILPAIFYLGFCAIFNAIWNVVFFKFYLPVVPNLNDQISWKGKYSWAQSGKILNEMSNYFFDTNYWGYAIYIFIGLWLVNFICTRNRQMARDLLLLISFFLCFFIMLHHFNLMNIAYTFRRAVMKFLLVMCLLISRFPLLQYHAGQLRQTKTSGR